MRKLLEGGEGYVGNDFGVGRHVVEVLQLQHCGVQELGDDMVLRPNEDVKR